eukprot:TRINITY_DN62916_c0_g1_i1.p1 TRINITY_DN62916_c0_g1~~TRINITY_DN62916_c0_g1_i1.p1  ORF type:complete len:321 (-),score=44.00 TRINITY_DN62916_c0_g1_i1:152-1114(-)
MFHACMGTAESSSSDSESGGDEVSGAGGTVADGSEASGSEEEAVDPELEARLVRQHQDEILLQSFGCWMKSFTVLVVLLGTALMVVWVWMLVESVLTSEQSCDEPLHAWVMVVCLVMALLLMPPGTLVECCLCRCIPGAATVAGAVRRLRLWYSVMALFVFAWNFVGLFWIHESGRDPDNKLPSCRTEVPGLYYSLRTYAGLSLAYTVFMHVNLIGLSRLLQVAASRGLLQTNNAAPPGALDANCEVISAAAAQRGGHTSCPVCLETFAPSDGDNIVRTRGCRHAFHRRCLQGWLNMNRTCPICRTDLGGLHEASGESAV